jgi:hypothetical protein
MNAAAGADTFWLRQEGKHVSYRQNSIISGGHIVCASRGPGTASGTRTKAESGDKRISSGSGPTASSNFTLWASLCALSKPAKLKSACKPCSGCSPSGNSASGKHACQIGRTAASGAAAGHSAGDSRACYRTTGRSATSHSASQFATSGNEFIVR